MTVDDSTTPPASQPMAFTAEHDHVLRAVVEQLHVVTARLEALEAQTSSADDNADTQPIPAQQATPMWRTKNGRQNGWQPARR